MSVPVMRNGGGATATLGVSLTMGAVGVDGGTGVRP
jgi:hypothetical protein